MKTQTWSLLTLVILAFLLGEIVYSLQADSNSVTAQEILDQSQEKTDYGFAFDSNVERWQEFIPKLNNLTTLELYLQKNGDPGMLLVEIRNLDGDVLFSTSRSSNSIPSYGWVRFGTCVPVSLTPGEKYRIVVTSDQPSGSPANQYAWRGSNQSEYRSDCATDVSASWPNYHYAFKTYGKPWEIFLPVILKD